MEEIKIIKNTGFQPDGTFHARSFVYYIVKKERIVKIKKRTKN